MKHSSRRCWPAPCAALHFRAPELQPGFPGIGEEIFVAGLPVLSNDPAAVLLLADMISPPWLLGYSAARAWMSPACASAVSTALRASETGTSGRRISAEHNPRREAAYLTGPGWSR